MSKGYDRQHRHDLDYIALARFWAQRRSKDPSTQCCAVIVRPDGTIASMGYNGFPMGVPDTPALLEDREQKYPRTVHAEINAIVLARESLHGHTLYQWPGRSCGPCAAVIVQAGIKRVVNPRVEGLGGHWQVSQEIGLDMFNKAGVEYMPIAFNE